MGPWEHLHQRKLSFLSFKVQGEGGGRYNFAFDRIFEPDVRQGDFFDYVGKPMIDSIFQGFNGTIFAYGQTGSGKTHTMEGPDIHDQEMKGLIPRMFDSIFEKIEGESEDAEFTVKVSYLEIYMEKIMDLLNPKK